MKLTAKVFERMDHVARRYDRLKEGFSNFLKGSEYLTESSSSIKGLSLEASLDENHFDVMFAGITIRFFFLIAYSTDGVLSGRVVVIRINPTFSDEKDIIGSFSFNSQGTTDFETLDGNDKLEIGYNAAEIVLHFLDQALAKPVP